MEILQGRYLRSLLTRKGKPKALWLEVPEGKVLLHLPKPLREIAQHELDTGDRLRAWATPKKKAAQDAKRKKALKKALKKSSRKSSGATVAEFTAVGLIPLTPTKTTVLLDRRLARQSAAEASLTVQLCQKKSCVKRGGDRLWAAFEATVNGREDIRLEATGCLGGCKRGPNLRLLPDNVICRQVDPEDIDTLLQRALDRRAQGVSHQP